MIKLETLQEDSICHRNFLVEILGNSKSNFIHLIQERLLQNRNKKSFPFDNGFVVVIEDKAIGYMFISGISNDISFLEYSLIKEYRGCGYGKLCLNEVTDYLFNNFNLKGIGLDIDPSNMASINTALACGYYPDDDLFVNNNMQGKIIYYRDNYNYINKRKH